MYEKATLVLSDLPSSSSTSPTAMFTADVRMKWRVHAIFSLFCGIEHGGLQAPTSFMMCYLVGAGDVLGTGSGQSVLNSLWSKFAPRGGVS
jgi:hypothetical protein